MKLSVNLAILFLCRLLAAPTSYAQQLDGFDPNLSGGGVLAIALQLDGNIIIGGDFGTVANQLGASARVPVG